VADSLWSGGAGGQHHGVDAVRLAVHVCTWFCCRPSGRQAAILRSCAWRSTKGARKSALASARGFVTSVAKHQALWSPAPVFRWSSLRGPHPGDITYLLVSKP
jgi:hypothetical protein